MRFSVKDATLALVVCAIGAAAQPGCRQGDRAMDSSGQRCHYGIWDELDLTAAQKEKLKSLRVDDCAVRSKNIEAIRTVREKIRNELLKSDPSESVLYGYSAELGELHKQISKSQNDHFLKVKQILTPEQFSKLLEDDRMGHHRRPEKNKVGKGRTGCVSPGAKCRGLKSRCPVDSVDPAGIDG